MKAPNLKIRIGSKTEMWNKVMKEVEGGRYAGPHKEPPFENYIQSPIRWVSKDGGAKTRLIFHLSYPQNGKGQSVNANIPEELCTMKYPDFNEVIALCVKTGKNCKIGKSDVSMAFQNVPLNSQSWRYLLLKAEHPESKKTCYFVEKCLPFGALIPCKIFQEISDVIAHIVSCRAGHSENVNYLDDYFFVELMAALCNWQINQLLMVCGLIGFPVALEKTVWATTRMLFLGLSIDTLRQVVCIPAQKISRALDMVEFFINSNNKKATVHQVQKLCGYLNFLCKCIVPGRAFLRRTYSLVSSKMKSHHHVRISQEVRKDMWIWKQFLEHQSIFCRPFMHFQPLTAEEITMYSDASRNFKLGFRAICEDRWTFGVWDEQFMMKYQPSIEFLELFGVTVAVIKWISLFKNRVVYLFCDNQSVVSMINNQSSTCKQCMRLICLVVLQGLVHNVKTLAKYVSTKIMV